MKLKRTLCHDPGFIVKRKFVNASRKIYKQVVANVSGSGFWTRVVTVRYLVLVLLVKNISK